MDKAEFTEYIIAIDTFKAGVDFCCCTFARPSRKLHSMGSEMLRDMLNSASKLPSFYNRKEIEQHARYDTYHKCMLALGISLLMRSRVRILISGLSGKSMSCLVVAYNTL